MKNLLKCTLITMLALTVGSCGNQTNSNDESNETTSNEDTATSTEFIPPSIEVSQVEDPTGLLPNNVKNADLEIDFLVYIEGQNGTMRDIGNPGYNAENITSIEMAKYIGAAREFKKLAPNVKINLIYCSIAEYPSRIIAYSEQRGHYPHLMWGTDHVVEMMANGYNTDLTPYAESEYYQSFNEYFMSRFNFGGFQGAIPIASEPWGVFVNLGALDTYYVTTTTGDEYKDWVDGFTWDAFLDACERTTDNTHAGLSKVVEYFTSYSAATINDQFARTGQVSLDTTEIQDLIYKESLLPQYTVYQYSDTEIGNTAKEEFPNAHNWSGTENFAKDQYATFAAEAPWSLTTMSQYIEENDLDTRIDYLPYPKVNADATTYTGIAVEGLSVGNLCPIDTNGNENCYSSTAKDETDVAAYFAMFMAADQRSFKGRSEVEYVFNNVRYKGSLSLPLIKKDFTYQWQQNADIVTEMGGDPAAAYDSNWEYQMALWFEVYNAYVTDDQPADVKEFSNITYGLTKVLDSIYGDEVKTINFWNDPVNIPDGDTQKDIFDDWQTRFVTQKLGTTTYYSDTIAKLSEWETEINTNSDVAWALLQEMLDNYYGSNKYDVSDRSNRNNY